jgi:zinc protease
MRLSVVGLATLLLATPAAAPAGPLAHREVRPNGITLLVAERPAVPIVVVHAWVRAGAVLDPPGAQGLAHLTAETLTRGTARRSASDLDRAIEFVGGSLEADAARDGVAVSLGVLRKDLDLGLDLLGEVLREPAFPEDEVRRTVGEIQASLRRAEENPETVASRELAPLIFPGHPYARRPTGTVESVGRLTREQVVEFHRRHYRPEATVVVAVGDIRAGEFRRALLARLGSWAGQPGLPPVIPEAARTAAPGSRRLARPLTQATALLGRPAIRQADPDYFPLLVANYVLGLAPLQPRPGGAGARLLGLQRADAGPPRGLAGGGAPDAE